MGSIAEAVTADCDQEVKIPLPGIEDKEDDFNSMKV